MKRVNRRHGGKPFRSNNGLYQPVRICSTYDIRNMNIKHNRADLQADHPGFHDKNYRIRRQVIASIAESHRTGSAPEHVNYTDDEFNAVFQDLRTAGLYRADDLPQMASINDYVQSKTGFTFRPVAGLLAARDFLSALAFRVFFSTQYIRHSSAPLYTPEPDVIHELLGHAPLLANPEFAEFSQLIGLASLGASEEDIQKLQRCYWFTVEFGLLLQPENNSLRAYGAGLLSSPGELLHATSPTNTRVHPRYVPLCANTRLQSVYHAAVALWSHVSVCKLFYETEELKRVVVAKYS
ncbi:UNVERIFIED_CONTAM: hypothetical protein H355_015263 [Colinus virginianus]|nr:hypothetical protein H355_015263 [Colinus virginianus]